MLSERDIEEFRYLFELGHLQSMELGHVDERRRLAGLQLLAEVERLRAHEADARLGTAVRALPDNHALRHYGALMLPPWYVFEYSCGEMVVSSARTPDAALADAGLLEEGDD